MDQEEQPSREITRLLIDWKDGNAEAMNELAPMVYKELRKLAAACLRNDRPGHTLQPTALIHEAYLRLIDQSMPGWQNRSHFFGVASRLMRQILVDFARNRQSQKRGGGKKVTLNEAVAFSEANSSRLLEINEALDRLAAFDERKCKVIELRYFGGLDREEIAEALAVSLATVKRDLALAEAWLRREMSSTLTGAAAAASS